MTVTEAVEILQAANNQSLLTNDQKERLRRILATKPKCPACRDMGGWFDGDSGELVSCSCKEGK